MRPTELINRNPEQSQTTIESKMPTKAMNTLTKDFSKLKTDDSGVKLPERLRLLIYSFLEMNDLMKSICKLSTKER
jgi:hypothetical protein